MKHIFLASLVLFAGAFALAGQEKKLDLSKVKCSFTAHVNAKNAPLPKGSKMAVTAKGIEMAYDFPSKGHDACMASFPVNMGPFSEIKVDFTAYQGGHRPFLVLTDKNGENHYFSIPNTRYIPRQRINGAGRKSILCKITVKNPRPGEYFAYRWGGDDNQRIDFPIKKIMLGLNDSPDTFVGKGKITFHTLTFK